MIIGEQSIRNGAIANMAVSLHLKYKGTTQWGNIRLFLQGYPIYIAGQRHKICGLLQI